MRTLPNYYRSLLKTQHGISKDYLSIIDKDVRRTKNCTTNLVKGAFVKNILLAFVKRNPEIGYLQGFNFMVEFFWKKGLEEEPGFWLFCHLAEDLVLYKFFNNLTPLFADVKIFKYFLFNKSKRLFKSIMQNRIDLFFIIHKWFLVNFLNIDNFPVSVSLVIPYSSFRVN